MHGVGVFDYASAGDVASQVYLCPFAPCTEPMMARGECLTFISAVAIRTPEHTVILRGSSLNLDGHDEPGQDKVIHQSSTMTVTAKGDSLAPAPRVNHQVLRNCHQAGQSDSQWLWHNCTKLGWTVATRELTIDVGVIGPYEEGWLKEGVSDRTFNLEVTGVKRQNKQVRGLINGDKNGYFEAAGAELLDAAIKVPQVTAANVAPGDVLFSERLKAHMDEQCGVMKHLQMVDSRRAGREAMQTMRSTR